MAILHIFNGMKLDLKNLNYEDIIFFDSETTGLEADGIDEMVQFAFVAKSKDLLNDEIENIKFDPKHNLYYVLHYVKPEFQKINQIINKFRNSMNLNFEHQSNLINTGFNDGMNSKQTALYLAKMIQNKVLVMHNGALFDTLFINKLLAYYDLKVPYALIDTLELAKQAPIYPMITNKYNKQVISYSQKALGLYYHVKNDDEHSALGDAIQLFEIFYKLLNEWSISEVNKWVIYSDILYKNIIDNVGLISYHGNKILESVTLFKTPWLIKELKQRNVQDFDINLQQIIINLLKANNYK